jgi:hypothetical protein
MTTIERIQAWLDNPVNRETDSPLAIRSYDPNKPDRIILRSHFVTNNGFRISIQQGATHYCTFDSVELWSCPHRPILDPYGDGEDPYARVPLSVVAAYIDELELE